MRRIISALMLAACLAIAGTAAPPVHAQAGGVVISFRNEMKVPVIVQGTSLINGMPRKGMALLVLPGKTVSDNNVPASSVRVYQVCDGNRPALQYVRNLPIRVGQDDIALAIRGVPPQVGVFVRKTEP